MYQVALMTQLVIVESPAKAKTIEKYLGKGYTVKASVGHVRDLPKSNKNAIDIEGGFIPNYEDVASKRPVIRELKKAAKDAEGVLLATDPDREGEAIAWHLIKALDLEECDANSKKCNVRRIAFNEITQDAVQEALKSPRNIDKQLMQAQEARRVLDRLVGYDLSGLIWKKVRYGLSAGRVQSPALRIIMEREREIRAFKPETFWVLSADVKGKKEEFTVVCVEEPRDKKEVDRIVKAGEKGDWTVLNIKETEAKRAPRPPFTTSTLQQTASSRLGFSPSRTMGAAQKLYEKGHITYMRTDSFALSKQSQEQILKTVEKDYGKEYVNATVYKNKGKNTQEAHEAVRPTDVTVRSAGMNADQKDLYGLIWARAMASQMTPAKVLRTKIEAGVDEKDFPIFRVNGSRILFPGWLAADPRSRGEDTELPQVEKGETLKLVKMNTEEKETTPPPRYSEAGLVKQLEERGIGRPSTYAAIIRTLDQRGYIVKEGRTLIPTDTGDVVSSFLEEYFMNYINDSFTSEMETELDEIAEGKREYSKTLKDFYGPFTKDIEKKSKEAKKITDLGPAGKEFPCPKCGKDMVIKLGRAGKFMSCSNFPECHGARTVDGEEVKEPDALGDDPESGEPIYVLQGPYGPYVQIGEKTAKNKKPKRAGIPEEIDAEKITLKEALKLLSLPRELGKHPESNKKIEANIGRFGPYIVHDGDFRSLKSTSEDKDKPDDPYTITLERALEILAQPKRGRRGVKVVKELGEHPRTKRQVKVYESKSGVHLKKGFKNIYLPDDANLDKFTLKDALELLKKG